MNPTVLMEKVAEVAPEEYAFFVKAAAELKTSPFVDEVRDELEGIMEKAAIAMRAPVSGLARMGGALGSMAGKALSSGPAKFLGGLGMAAGTAAAGGIALALATDMYGAAKRGLTKSRNYQAMLEANPDLRDLSSERVRQTFSTLHRLNPTFAGDPTVAGALVRREAMSDLPQWDPQQLKTLVDANKAIVESSKLPSFSPTGVHDYSKAQQGADADFQYEKNRPQHEAFEAQARKYDAAARKNDAAAATYQARLEAFQRLGRTP